MRIGLSCTSIEPSITHGKIDGIGVYTQTLLDEYLKQNLKVYPYSFPKGQLKNQKSQLHNGTKFPYSYPISSIISLYRPASNILYKTQKDNIDIFHSTDHTIPRIKGIPVIATLHDAIMFKHPEFYKFGKLKNWLRKKTFAWADHFITISHAMKKELIYFLKIPEEKISVVYLGISDWWFERVSIEKKSETLIRLNLPSKFILCTGTLQPKKNIPRLIEAFLKLPEDLKNEYPLIITGRLGWKTDPILASINKLTSTNKGKWIEYISLDDLRTLYQSACLFIHPSLHEGFGYTLVEAFASKTPVITSNVTAMPEIAGDAAYLIDPESIDEIKEGMQKLLTSPSLREQYIHKGIIRGKEFSLNKCAKETLAIYNKIIT